MIITRDELTNSHEQVFGIWKQYVDFKNLILLISLLQLSNIKQ